MEIEIDVAYRVDAVRRRFDAGSEYPDPRAMTVKACAWEFLRRSPAYWRAFEVSRHLPADLLEDGLVRSLLDRSDGDTTPIEWLETHPDGLPGETLGRWKSRVHRDFRTLAGLVAPHWPPRTFGLRKFIDPELSELDSDGIFLPTSDMRVTLITPDIDSIGNAHYIGGESLTEPSEVLVKFDVAFDLDEQLDAARGLLRDRQRELKDLIDTERLKDRRPPKDPEMYRRYWRLLDGYLSNHSVPDTLRRFYPEEAGIVESQTYAWKDLQRALAIVGGGYLKLLNKQWPGG